MERPLYNKIVQLSHLIEGFNSTFFICNEIQKHYVRPFPKTTDITILRGWVTAFSTYDDDISLYDYHLIACNELYRHVKNANKRNKL